MLGGRVSSRSTAIVTTSWLSFVQVGNDMFVTMRIAN